MYSGDSRLSHEFLSGQVAELSKRVKDLETKAKKSPDDLKAQLKSFLGVSWPAAVQLTYTIF